jgi:hypothetical protein
MKRVILSVSTKHNNKIIFIYNVYILGVAIVIRNTLLIKIKSWQIHLVLFANLLMHGYNYAVSVDNLRNVNCKYLYGEAGGFFL